MRDFAVTATEEQLAAQVGQIWLCGGLDMLWPGGFPAEEPRLAQITRLIKGGMVDVEYLDGTGGRILGLVCLKERRFDPAVGAIQTGRTACGRRVYLLGIAPAEAPAMLATLGGIPAECYGCGAPTVAVVLMRSDDEISAGTLCAEHEKTVLVPVMPTTPAEA